MRKIYGMLFLLALSASCGRNRTAEPQPGVQPDTDSVRTDTLADSLAQEEPEPPLAADGLFGDFIFNFMRSQRFQRERVRFPLAVRENGAERLLPREEWKHDRLYAKAEVYTMLFDDVKSMGNSKDTAVKRVTVDMLDFKRKSVKQYIFNKERGAWLLTGLDIHPLAQDVNSDFYTFYLRFAGDAAYRRGHVANPFALTITDPDSFEPMKGDADAAQWDDYAPELPRDLMANVNYGQTYAPTGQRVLLVSSVDGAMTSSITFRKRGKNWVAVKLEND